MQLLTEAVDADPTSSRESSTKPGTTSPALPNQPCPEAERRIPVAWKTIDRVLDLQLWCPDGRKASRKNKVAKKGKGKNKRRVVSDDEEEEEDEQDSVQAEYDAAFAIGEQPSAHLMETVDAWEARTKQKFSVAHIEKVVWGFMKWDDLGYDEGKCVFPPIVRF